MKKFASLLLAGLLGLSVLTGCGGSTEPTGDLNIRVFSGGYGHEWVQRLEKGYEAKYGIEVEVYPTVQRNQIQSDMIVENPADQKYDLYFSDYTRVFTEAKEGYFADITDVYEYTNEGESQPIQKKLHPYIVDKYEENGRYYYISGGISFYGFTYNKLILDDYYIPRTTGEMLELCEDLKADGIKAFVFGNDTNYWDEIFLNWWAQYSGKDKFEMFFHGKTSASGLVTKDIFNDIGRLRAYEVIEQMLSYDNAYIDLNSTGYDYIQAQRQYLLGGAAMMVNGSWLENEMRLQFPNGHPDAELDFMDMPVISSIVEKLPSLDALSAEEKEARLRETITYIDNGRTGTKPSVISDDDINAVAEARTLQSLSSSNFTGAIPGNAKHIDEAKRFLEYMYSDEGIALFTSDTGAQLPLAEPEYDADWLAEQKPLVRTALVKLPQKDWFFQDFTDLVVAGLTPRHSTVTLESYFGAQNPNDRKTAYEVYQDDIKYYSDNNGAAWNLLLSNAGIR